MSPNSLLDATNNWLEVCRNIKNTERLIEKYPGDASLQVELQERKKRAAKLKTQIDNLKKVKENVQQTRQDCEGIEW